MERDGVQDQVSLHWGAYTPLPSADFLAPSSPIIPAPQQMPARRPSLVHRAYNALHVVDVVKQGWSACLKSSCKMLTCYLLVAAPFLWASLNLFNTNMYNESISAGEDSLFVAMYGIGAFLLVPCGLGVAPIASG